MSSSEKDAKTDGVPDIMPFAGPQKFEEWKNEILTTAIDRYEFITNGGEIIHNHIQSEVDMGLGAAGKTVLKTHVSDYDDETVWKVKFKKDYMINLKAEKLKCLNKWSKSWDDAKKNLCDTEKELKDLQTAKINVWFRNLNRQFIKLLQNSVTRSKSTTKELDFLNSILFSQSIMQFMQGKDWKTDYVAKPQHQPAVKAWASILQRFEGLNNATSTNFICELGQIMDQATGKKALSVRDVIAQVDKTLTPVACNFGDVKSFCSYLIACVGAQVIHLKAQAESVEGKAYLESDKMLINLRHENVLLTLELIEKAVRVAEELNHHNSTPDGSNVKTLKTEMESREENPQSENPYIVAIREEMKKLTAMFTSNNRQETGGGKAGKGGKKGQSRSEKQKPYCNKCVECSPTPLGC